MAKRKSTWSRFWAAASHPTRDGTMFILGVAGILWETLAEDADRPYLLVLFAAMCGLPVFLNLDEHAPKLKLPTTLTKPDQETPDERL